MDKIANVKAQLRLQKWPHFIEECQLSNMTVTAWCEANDIHIKTYYYWLRKVRNHTLQQMLALTEGLAADQGESPVI